MILRQLLHQQPAVPASYVFGCGGEAAGAVCDPIDDPGLYIGLARESNLNIGYVIDTHLHADQVSGGRRLVGTFKRRIHPARKRPTRSMRFTAHGRERCLTRAPEPWFLLTGHTLMVGDVGQTEPATDFETNPRQLFGTAQRLKEFPEYLEVLPGTYAGSVCGRVLSGKAVSTIGFERRFNRAFQINGVDHFVIS